MATLTSVLVAGLAVFGGYTYGPAVKRTVTLMGLARTNVNTPVAHAGDLIFIDDTTHCEDIHHHVPSGLLFTACEDTAETRPLWFPGLGHLDDPVKGSDGRGSIHVIDPKDMTQKRLKFENFDGTFVTHGIDVISDPENPAAVYIFAVNHVPNPEYLATKIAGQADRDFPEKAQSRVEIFHYTLGSPTVKHLRSVLHPLVKTPNDIFIKDPHSFYVTNDHFYRDGAGRLVEDLWPGTSWTDTIHVRVESLSARLPTEGVAAEVALQGLRNNNGLGRGRHGEILIDNCAKGELHVGKLSSDPKNASVDVVQVVRVDSYIDNPSWFEDPYRSETHDASGFVLPGLARPIEIPKEAHHPSPKLGSMVWYVKPTTGGADGWEKRLLFQDDGTRASGAAAAVLVAIDPAKENGQRKAWLFVTGFMSSNVVAVKVDL
ncbi:Serum paraoxonase/arylesterase 2 [Colletotrichum chlorophyti]|uniref:Serum paraoxonase/arylesterase 2 n=1 Tax=Colletotrichum chlorophyti TaxID=708187 RepID=A0A1Q8RWG3_9PEZI|nr:Serum paraoxonase/arylesterase 2 [Colletotrichum chlorophyti]